jgi:hypothetical protein
VHSRKTNMSLRFSNRERNALLYRLKLKKSLLMNLYSTVSGRDTQGQHNAIGSRLLRVYQGVGYTVPSEVFRPLDFFHILLSYRFILKWILKVLINLHTIPYNDKARTGFYKCLLIY